MDGKRLKKIIREIWPALVLILFLFLRLPSLFEPFTYGDEGIYLTLGQALRKGLVFYRDIHDNKPPLIYLLAALAGNFYWYRIIYFFWSLVTLISFYKLAQLLFGKNQKAVILGTFVFTILTNLHLFEGNVANAENFMILPTLAAWYMFLKRRHWFLIGIFFSLAALFKIPAGFDLAAFLVIASLLNKRCFQVFLSSIINTLLGFFLPIFATVIYFWSKGALFVYLNAAFFQNIPYLASWGSPKNQSLGLPYELLFRGWLVFLITLGIFFLRKKIARPVVLVILWFSFSLFAALLSSRPYPHYLLQTLPALSLAWGLFMTNKKPEKLVPLILSLTFFFTFQFFHFWHYPNQPYYQNFYQFVFGQKSREQYIAHFGQNTQSIYQTAIFIKTHTQNQEKIFVWGDQPAIYALSDRLPVGRYTVAYHIRDFNGWQETMRAISDNPPRYLILMTEAKNSFPALSLFIHEKYLLQEHFGQIQIFHKIYQ